jgi:hypothetical protein
LPPVFQRISNERRNFTRAPRTTSSDRRHGRREDLVPDVRFRWQPAPRESPLPDHAHQISR